MKDVLCYIPSLTHLIPPGFPTTTQNVSLPVDAGALDAQQYAEVDGGPARVGLAAVAALLVARQTLDPLQDGLPSDAALPRLAGRVDAAGGWRSRSVQMLNMNDTQTKPLITALLMSLKTRRSVFSDPLSHLNVVGVWTLSVC